jgi:uncharacterized phiE125 gp8 family phage protein
MSLEVIAHPTSEPITVAEAKLNARCDDSTEDSLWSVWISGLRRQLEHDLQRSIMPQTYELLIDRFPPCAGAIRLAMPPVQSVSLISYVGLDGLEHTMSSAAYVLDARTKPGWVMPLQGTDWPAAAAVANGIRVRFVAGYTAVPPEVRSWMLVKTACAYRFREALQAGMTLGELPRDYVDGLVDGLRYWGG